MELNVEQWAGLTTALTPPAPPFREHRQPSGGWVRIWRLYVRLARGKEIVLGLLVEDDVRAVRLGEWSEMFQDYCLIRRQRGWVKYGR